MGAQTARAAETPPLVAHLEGGMSLAWGADIFVTDFGCVRVSEGTIKAMDATFPGWRDAPLKGRKKAIREYNAHAKRGRETLENVVSGIAFLTWYANQDFEQI